MDKDLEKLLKHVERIDHKLTVLLNRPPKQTWVKVSAITEITGWNNEKMRRARENKMVQYRKAEKGFEYLIESIPEIFITKQTA